MHKLIQFAVREAVSRHAGMHTGYDAAEAQNMCKALVRFLGEDCITLQNMTKFSQAFHQDAQKIAAMAANSHVS